MNHLIIVLGPTGIGKSSISLKIAQHFRTEIISADSRQIYKELSIGTAIPSEEELSLVKHHFIQNKSIHDYYNASEFEFDVLDLLEKLFAKKDIILLTGGSMLYIDAVCKGIDIIPNIEPSIREEVLTQFEERGIATMLQDLKEMDPEYYEIVDKQNPKRVLHAIEVCKMTGKTYSSFRTNTRKTRPFNMIKIGINQNREELYERINKRVDKMFEDGLIKEARSVFQYKHLNSLNTVGYKELFEYFDNQISLSEAIDKIKGNTRKYARKQLTWFRKDDEIKWFEPNQTLDIINYIEKITTH